jgi:hypothetical protein
MRFKNIAGDRPRKLWCDMGEDGMGLTATYIYSHGRWTN